MTVMQIISVCVVLISLLSFFISWRGYQNTKKSLILSNYLMIQEKIENVFADYKKSMSPYDLTRAINVIESLCHLYDKKFMPSIIKVVVRNYLKDFLTSASNGGKFINHFYKTKQNETTYESIIRFCKKNRIKWEQNV